MTENSDAFLSSEVIAKSKTWFVFKCMLYYIAKLFNGMKIEGVENLPKDDGALVVGMHSTHNYDIVAGLIELQLVTGRVIRGLFHKNLFVMSDSLRYIGGVPGERNTAKHLISAGHLVGVLPGGGEEMCRGHENAYTLKWESSNGRRRLGYAHVALSIGRPMKIIPLFHKNVEEMRFNPLTFLANLIGLTWLWSYVCAALKKNKATRPLGAFVFVFGMFIAYNVAFLGIPMPVQSTIIYGKAIDVDPDKDTPEEVADRVEAALRGMIATRQPHGHSYLPGIKERWNVVFGGNGTKDKAA